MSPPLVREATRDDAEAVRSLVTRSLLSAGFPPPDAELDEDLIDLSYYATDHRRIWVAEREGDVVGCAALDRGEGHTAVLRRLAGGGLEALVETAVRHARAEGLAAVETVLPPGLPGTRDALKHAGFAPMGGANAMLLRLDL